MDEINPDYYKGKIECIDAIAASLSGESFRGFLKGNVFKYLWRYETKHKSGVTDLQKAAWYLDRLIKEEAKEEVKRGV